MGVRVRCGEGYPHRERRYGEGTRLPPPKINFSLEMACFGAF